MVPTKRTRRVRIDPNAASLRDAGFSDSGDLASPELWGAAVYRIQKNLMRYPSTGVRRWRTLMSLSRATADCHHIRRPPVNLGEGARDMLEWFEAVA